MSLFDPLLLYGSGVASGLALVCALAVGWLLRAAIPDSDRTYADPLPLGLRLIWGPVQVVGYYGSSNLAHGYLNAVDQRLEKTGINYLMNAEEFVALRLVLTVIVTVIALVVMDLLEAFHPLILLAAPILGFYLPQIWLRDSRLRRQNTVIRDLPVYLDFLTMAVEAGLNLSGALGQAMNKGPRGAMCNEFAIVLRDLRSGLSRADALRRMADRLDIKEITGFVNSMIQAERMGSSLANTLRVQAEQRREERFQRAEKAAMEAPVKLVFPLIVFIFPVTFIILGFPLVMKFMAEGMF